MVFRGEASIEVIDHLAPRFEASSRFAWLSIIDIRSALEVFRQQRPGKTVDLSRLGILLERGETYRVETNNSHTIFHIDPDAKEKEGSKPVRLPHKLSSKITNGYR